MGPLLVFLVSVLVLMGSWQMIARKLAQRNVVLRHLAATSGALIAGAITFVVLVMVSPAEWFEKSESRSDPVAKTIEEPGTVPTPIPKTSEVAALDRIPTPDVAPTTPAGSSSAGGTAWRKKAYQPGSDAPPWMAGVVLSQNLAAPIGLLDATNAGKDWPLKQRELQVTCSRSGVIVLDDDSGRPHAVGLPQLVTVDGLPVSSMAKLFRTGERSEEVEAAVAALAQPLCDFRKQASPETVLTPERLSGAWPFVVDQVVLHCIAPKGVYGFAGGKLYGLNNPPADRMRANNAHPPNEILAEPDNLMARMPVIQAGLGLCD